MFILGLLSLLMGLAMVTGTEYDSYGHEPGYAHHSIHHYCKCSPLRAFETLDPAWCLPFISMTSSSN